MSAPPDALVSGLVATLVSGLVPTNALATGRVHFVALTSQGSLVRSLSRLLLFEKPTPDRGCDHAAAHSIGAA
jgi:hypothetical protein